MPSSARISFAALFMLVRNQGKAQYRKAIESRERCSGLGKQVQCQGRVFAVLLRKCANVGFCFSSPGLGFAV